jgi:hypothetical protein
MPRPINYALDRSASYEGVQRQLLDLIDAHLPEPKPTPEVTEFMDDYLEPRWFGRSSARIAEVLTEIAAH